MPPPTSVLVILDVQNDFCAGGALAVPDAELILPVINRITPLFRRVIVTQDWHPLGHVSFASSHSARCVGDSIAFPWGEQLLWPAHCIAGTAGAALHPGLHVPPDAVILHKGVHRDVDSYSAFVENDGVTPVGLDGLLRGMAACEIVLAGLATDYCVLRTALDGRRLGYHVAVVEAACRGIGDQQEVAEAWSRMEAAGVRRIMA
ncbi:MAG: bifunctional nicotinamidase/pyrazinamidase [Planctomycetaceae bacterium]